MLPHLFRHNVREHHSRPSPFSFATQVFGHLLRPSAHVHRDLPRGALVGLNLAVSPSAASSPTCGAKVPHAIAFLAARPTAVSAPVLVFNHSSSLGKLA